MQHFTEGFREGEAKCVLCCPVSCDSCCLPPSTCSLPFKGQHARHKSCAISSLSSPTYFFFSKKIPAALVLPASSSLLCSSSFNFLPHFGYFPSFWWLMLFLMLVGLASLSFFLLFSSAFDPNWTAKVGPEKISSSSSGRSLQRYHLIAKISFNIYIINSIDNRIIAKVTSYQIVCATAQSAPIKVYFEFEAHPGQRIE